MEHSTAMLIVYNINKIEKIPAHGCTWEFSDVEKTVGRSLLYRLRDSGLLVQHEPGVYSTSKELGKYIKNKHEVTLES